MFIRRDYNDESAALVANAVANMPVSEESPIDVFHRASRAMFVLNRFNALLRRVKIAGVESDRGRLHAVERLYCEARQNGGAALQDLPIGTQDALCELFEIMDQMSEIEVR